MKRSISFLLAAIFCSVLAAGCGSSTPTAVNPGEKKEVKEMVSPTPDPSKLPPGK